MNETFHIWWEDKAREIAKSFGYTERPVDTFYAWEYDQDYLRLAREQKSSSAELSTRRAVYFWYRQSPQYPITSDPDTNTFRREALGLGMQTVKLDSEGRLLEWRSGDKDAATRLMELVCRELHQMASRQMRRKRGEHTLQTTALVHEAYIRLCGAAPIEWHDRTHFFAVAAQTVAPCAGRLFASLPQRKTRRRQSLRDAIRFGQRDLAA